MNEKDYEEMLWPAPETDDDEEEDESQKNSFTVNSSFSELSVKKIKPTKELIESFTFDNLDYLTIKDAHESYIHSYSMIDFLTLKFCNGVSNTINRIGKIELFNVNPHLMIDSIFKFKDIIPMDAYSSSITKTNGNLKAEEFLVGFKDEYLNPILLYVEYSSCTVLYYKNRKTSENKTLSKILGIIETYTEPKINKNKIFVVHKTQHGFDKTGFKVKKVNIDLNENYNDDFPSIAKEIISGLNKKNMTNLVILSGVTGSGKTTFIRYMAARLKKNIIFISPDMVNYITDPSFIPFLIKNNDSILIIEDAEPALETRDTGRTGAVSNILNLTDGLLSDCLNISIVATFNTESNKIDSALLRKGRLLKNYKFDKLSASKSSILLKKLGHNVEAKEPMSLSDIYYYAENNNAPENKDHKVIGGFGRR